MNVEEKLLRGTKGTNGRGQIEKGKVAKYGEGHVLSITHPCIVGKDRAQQEIAIILFILFFFFGLLSQAQFFILLLIIVPPWSTVWMGKTAPGWCEHTVHHL